MDLGREGDPGGPRPGAPPECGWDRWFRDHDPTLLAASRRPGHGLEADDAGQEARLACLTALGRYRGDAAGLRAWLAAVVRNRLINAGRRPSGPAAVPLGREAAALAATAEEGPAAIHERTRVVAGVRAALEEARARLPGPSYLAVVLRCCEGRSTAEVAATLGLSQAEVRDRYRRAVPKFRAVLARRLGADLLEVAGVAWGRSNWSREELTP